MSTAMISSTPPTATRPRLTTLLAALAAAAALSVGPTGSATAATPVLSGSGCVLVQQLVVYNPSMNKPRAEQVTPDHRHWDAGCF
jgi:hypothetical protein